jgi:hypothetical protein
LTRRLFGDVLPGTGAERIKNELKWLTNELAERRELDEPEILPP